MNPTLKLLLLLLLSGSLLTGCNTARGMGEEPGSCYFSRGQLTLFHQAILIHILTFYLIPFLHFFFS